MVCLIATEAILFAYLIFSYAYLGSQHVGAWPRRGAAIAEARAAGDAAAGRFELRARVGQARRACGPTCRRTRSHGASPC